MEFSRSCEQNDGADVDTRSVSKYRKNRAEIGQIAFKDVLKDTENIASLGNINAKSK